MRITARTGVNADLKAPCLVAGMAAGAGSIHDMDVRRHGAMGTLFDGIRAVSGGSDARLVMQCIGQLATARDPELFVDVLQMVLHRSHRDVTISGDLLVRTAGRVTGTITPAARSNDQALRWASVILYLLLLAAWLTVAGRTRRRHWPPVPPPAR